MAESDTKWLDEAPDATWLDDAPDAPAPASPASEPSTLDKAGAVADRIARLNPMHPKTLLGNAEAALALGSRAVAYPVGIAAAAGEFLSPFKWGKGVVPEKEPMPTPVDVDGNPIPLDKLAPEMRALLERENAQQNAQRADEANLSDAWKRGGEARKAVEDAIAYTPHTEAGKEALAGGAKVLGVLGKPVEWAGGKIADMAVGKEPPPNATRAQIEDWARRRAIAKEIGTTGAGLVGGEVLRARPGARAASEYLGEKAIESGRKALSGVGGTITARKPIPAEVVQQAIDEGAIRPFATVKGIAERLKALADEHGVPYGNILDALAAKGVHGPNAEALAAEFERLAQQTAHNSLRSPKPGMLRDTAKELQGEGEFGMALPVSGKGRLGLDQAEQMKRTLQAEASKEYDKISRQYTPTGEAKKEIAGRMKDAIEEAVDQQSHLAPGEAAAFQPVKQRLSRTLEALKAAEEGAGRASRRSHFGLKDTAAGLAAAATTHNPFMAAIGAIGHALIDRRLASTGASIENALSKALAPGSPMAGGVGATTVEAAGPLSSRISSALESLKPANQPSGGLGLTPAAADERGSTTAPTAPAPQAPGAGSAQTPSVAQPPTSPPGPLGTTSGEDEDGKREPHSTDKLALVAQADPRALGPYAGAILTRLRVGGPMAVTQWHFLQSQRDPAYRAHMAKVIGDDRVSDS